MSIEELRILLDAFVAMGEAGKTAFIWWLVVGKVVPGLIVLACVWLLVAAGRFWIKMAFMDGLSESRLIKLRDLMDLKGAHDNMILTGDYENMAAWINKRKNSTWTIQSPPA